MHPAAAKAWLLIATLMCFAAAPTNAADLLDATGADLEWEPAAGPVVGYGVFVSRNGAPYPSSPTFTTTTAAVTLPASPGETLRVKVAAYDRANGFGAFSDESDALTFVPGQGPAIALSTATILAQQTLGQDAPSQAFVVRNSGTGSLAYQVSTDEPGLILSSSAGTTTDTPDTITVSFASAGLGAGNYTGNISVSAPGLPTQNITVNLVVSDPARPTSINLLPAALTASTIVGANAPAQYFAVRNAGAGTLSYIIVKSAPWLSIGPLSGTSTGEADLVTVDYATDNLAPGFYSGTVTVMAGGIASQTLKISLTVLRDEPELLAIGLGPGASGAIERVLGEAPFGRTGPVSSGVGSGSDGANGESRPVACDVDGDGSTEWVVGFGRGSGALVEVLTGRALTHRAWIQVPAPTAYNNANGETFVGCGNFDGDGSDEIAVGLGQGGGGLVYLFDDADTGFAPMAGSPLAAPWPKYAANVGEIHPAGGDFDGDGRDELVIGFGTGGASWLFFYDDATTGFAPLPGTDGGWLQVPWPGYAGANGATYPAAGDLDGDGVDELVIGLSSGGGAWLMLYDDAITQFAPMPGTSGGWLQVPWAGYAGANGSTHPALGNLDGDSRMELVVGLGVGGYGYLAVFDDATNGFRAMPGAIGEAPGWIRATSLNETAGGGVTWPAVSR